MAIDINNAAFKRFADFADMQYNELVQGFAAKAGLADSKPVDGAMLKANSCACNLSQSSV